MNNMSENNYREGFQWGPFLLGMLYLLLGFFAFNNPVISIVSVAYVFAIGVILRGGYDLFFRRKYRQHVGYSSTPIMILGVINILVGVFFLFNIFSAVIALPFIFAFWLIIDSLGTIFTASPIKKYSNTQYWFTLIVGIFGVVIGLMLLFNPLSSFIAIATLIGMYFVLVGTLNIVYAF